MDKISDLSNQLANLSDEELLTILFDSSTMYSNEAIQTAKIIAELRGLVSKFNDIEFKVITTDGRENGRLNVLNLKDLFLKKLINEESLLYVESKNQWFTLKEIFNIDYWEPGDKQVNFRNESSINTTNNTTNDLTDELKNQITEQSQENHSINNTNINASRYEGVGGWLGFFVFSLLFCRPFGLVMTNANLQYAPQNVAKFWLVAGLIDVGLGVIVALILLCQFRLAPLITKIYLLFVIIGSILFPFLATAVLGNSVKIRLGEMIASMVIPISLTIVWLIYFSVSKRVKATYKS